MKYARHFTLFCICVLSFCFFSHAQNNSLSYSNIKELYKEGEFPKIRSTLEAFLKKAGTTADPKEKIFAYKYLGVAYAVDPSGYALAETYFYQLLKLAPNAYLSDLYVSSAIQSLFEKTKARFIKETTEENSFDEFGNPRSKSNISESPTPSQPKDPRQKQQPKIKSEHHIWPWVALGAGVAVGVTAYFILSKPKSERLTINSTP